MWENIPPPCTCVHPEMQFERSGVTEGAGADLAGVGALASVHTHMDGQLATLVEPVERDKIDA